MSKRIATRLGPRDIADLAWAVAQTLPQFGYAEISVRSSISGETAARHIKTWLAEGRLITIRQAEPRVRGLWKIDPAYLGKPAAQVRTVEECLWTAMRQSRSFTPRVLAAHAQTPDVEVSLEATQAYCRALLAAGYLTVSRKAEPGKIEPIYRLIRNSGPRAPREKRVRAVVDANTDETIVIGGVQ